MAKEHSLNHYRGKASLMAKTVTVAIDAMGGDHGPPVIVPAARNMCGRYPDLHLVLIGRAEEIEPLLQADSASTRISIVDAREVVNMDEPAADALRKEKEFIFARRY